MEKKKILIIFLVFLILIGLGLATKFLYLDRQNNQISALRVYSTPKADLYINDQIAGKTPYSNEKMAPGEYKLKLIATGATGTFFPWETKIKLTSSSLTYVSRDIGPSDDESGGQILWLEKISTDKNAQFAVVSDPDRAKVSIDGVERGTASTIIKDIPLGNHEITISLDGYSDQIIKAKIIAGYRVNAAVKLARTNISTPATAVSPVASTSAAIQTATKSASASDNFKKPYVLVKETGTGFLRVRTEPSISATEAGKVKPGDKYTLLSEAIGWSKIQISTSSGWVSDQYIQKFK